MAVSHLSEDEQLLVEAVHVDEANGTQQSQLARLGFEVVTALMLLK